VNPGRTEARDVSPPTVHELVATAEWVDWFNNQRRHTAIGDIPPHEYERPTTLNTSPNRRLKSTHRASTDPGAVHRAVRPPRRQSTGHGRLS
jgi:hypothetical protein